MRYAEHLRRIGGGVLVALVVSAWGWLFDESVPHWGVMLACIVGVEMVAGRRKQS